MLNDHPSLVVKGELFNRLHGEALELVVDREIAKLWIPYPFFVKAVGFKLLYTHPFDTPSARPLLWTKVKAMDHLAVIHLKRTNVLRTLVSAKIAQERTREWKASGPRPTLDQRRIAFDPAELQSGIEETQSQQQAFEEEILAMPHINVTYESLITAPQEQIARIALFLGAKPRTLHTTLERQNPEPLPSLVSNYQELKDTFADTRWASFFED